MKLQHDNIEVFWISTHRFVDNMHNHNSNIRCVDKASDIIFKKYRYMIQK